MGVGCHLSSIWMNVRLLPSPYANIRYYMIAIHGQLRKYALFEKQSKGKIAE
jgi:hypothetical protein